MRAGKGQEKCGTSAHTLGLELTVALQIQPQESAPTPTPSPPAHASCLPGRWKTRANTISASRASSQNKSSRQKGKLTFFFLWLPAEFAQMDAFPVRTTNSGVWEVDCNPLSTPPPGIPAETNNTSTQHNPKQKDRTQQKKWKKNERIPPRMPNKWESIAKPAYQTGDTG